MFLLLFLKDQRRNQVISRTMKTHSLTLLMSVSVEMVDEAKNQRRKKIITNTRDILLQDSASVSLGWDHNLSFLSSPHTHTHTQAQVLSEYFITTRSAIIQLQTRVQPTISSVNHACWVSHTTLFGLVSIQSDHVMSRVCVPGPSPMRPWNARSRSVPFSHCCSCFPLVPTQKLCPRRAIDFSRVISVFPFTGRKWNNNRGQRENHGVTLRQSCCVSPVPNPKWDLWGLILSLMRYSSAPCAVTHTSPEHFTLSEKRKKESDVWAPLFTRYCGLDFRFVPNMRKLWWNPCVIFLCKIQTGNSCRVQHLWYSPCPIAHTWSGEWMCVL